ncbi:MAG: paraquat-inducible protein A [Colwellia sp.]|nr:paraquat-inducible protein A [Colwellia sp.]
MKKRKIACHDCDLLMLIPHLKHRQEAVCPRCGFILTRFYQHAPVKLLAFTLTALVFLTFSLKFPFLIFSLHGNEKSLTLIESIQSFSNINYIFVSILLFSTAIVIPLLFLLSIVYVSWSFNGRGLLPFTPQTLKFALLILPWNMAEIFLVSILVSLIKIMTLANVNFGLSFFSYILFIISLSATLMYFDRYQLWSTYQLKLRKSYG